MKKILILGFIGALANATTQAVLTPPARPADELKQEHVHKDSNNGEDKNLRQEVRSQRDHHSPFGHAYGHSNRDNSEGSSEEEAEQRSGNRWGASRKLQQAQPHSKQYQPLAVGIPNPQADLEMEEQIFSKYGQVQNQTPKVSQTEEGRQRSQRMGQNNMMRWGFAGNGYY